MSEGSTHRVTQNTHLLQYELLPFLKTLEIIGLLLISKQFVTIKNYETVWKQAYATFISPFSTFPGDLSLIISVCDGWYAFICRVAHSPASCHTCHVKTTRYFSMKRGRRVCLECRILGDGLVCAISSKGFYNLKPIGVVSSYKKLMDCLQKSCDGDTILVSKGFKVPHYIQTDVALRIMGKTNKITGSTPRLQASGRFPVVLATAPIVIENLTIEGFHFSSRVHDYMNCMCALDIRSSCVIRRCYVTCYGSALIVNLQGENQPRGLIIENNVFHGCECAGICFSGTLTPSIVTVAQNLIKCNGWGYQDDQNQWGRVIDIYPEIIANNDFVNNEMGIQLC
jgi:hypothetical protein